jgi:hypothetical protein
MWPGLVPAFFSGYMLDIPTPTVHFTGTPFLVSFIHYNLASRTRAPQWGLHFVRNVFLPLTNTL